MKEVQEADGLEFEPEFSNTVYTKYCEVFFDTVWGKTEADIERRTSWFPSTAKTCSAIIGFESAVSKLQPEFKIRFSNGESMTSSFDEEKCFQSFYVDEKV